MPLIGALFYTAHTSRYNISKEVPTIDSRYTELVAEWENNTGVKVIDKSPTFNQVDKIEFLIVKGKYKEYSGSTHLSNIQRGGGITFQSLLPSEKTRWYIDTLPEYGARYVSGEHINMQSPIEIEITDGRYAGYKGTVSKSLLVQKAGRGKKNKLNFSVLHAEEKVRYFNNYAHSRGYKIIELPEGLNIRGKCILESPQGNIWRTVWYYFAYQEGNNCPQDAKISYGEAVILEILKVNNIGYEYQKTIETKNGNQYIDFYIEDRKIAIEYNGKQHYYNTGGYHSDSLEVIKNRDRQKEHYCKINNIKLIIVSYEQDTLDKIHKVLQEKLGIELKKPNRVTNSISLDEQEVLSYYNTHSAKDTIEKYNVTKRRLQLMAKRHNFSKRGGGFL